MPIHSLRYRFRQSFDAPARAAFDWCVDFRPTDVALMPGSHSRSVQRLLDDTVILIDVTHPQGRRRQIHRLVRIDPRQMAWTNTHLDGPFRHSQYWYRIVSDGPRRSHLEFEGMRLVTSPQALPAGEIARAAANERAADSGMWRRSFKPALERDLRTPRSSR
jgi:hypothetical protein